MSLMPVSWEVVEDQAVHLFKGGHIFANVRNTWMCSYNHVRMHIRARGCILWLVSEWYGGGGTIFCCVALTLCPVTIPSQEP